MADGPNPINSSNASGAAPKSQLSREKAKLFLTLRAEVIKNFGQKAFDSGYAQLMAGIQPDYINAKSTVEVNEENRSVKLINPETNKVSATFIFEKADKPF